MNKRTLRFMLRSEHLFGSQMGLHATYKFHKGRYVNTHIYKYIGIIYMNIYICTAYVANTS